jgi:cytochrome o ubiquinol oxidase subunit 1
MSRFDDPSLQIWFQVALCGALLVALGILCFIIQLYVSYKNRVALSDNTGDPWNGRTLEWSTSSPPPQYNFAFTPRVHDIDAWWQMKANGFVRPTDGFMPIHMPKNTAAGIVLAGISGAFGFAMIWHMWLVAGLAFVALLAAIIIHTFNYNREYYIPVEEVEKAETKFLAKQVELADTKFAAKQTEVIV